MEKFKDIFTNFIATEKWTYTKTIPKWPQESIVRERVYEKLFFETVLNI